MFFLSYLFSEHFEKYSLSTPLRKRADKKLIVIKWDILDISNIIKTFFQNQKSLYFLFSCYIISDSFTISWTIACQAPLSMGFPRQGDWSALPFPSPGNLPDPGTELTSPALKVDSLSVGHLGRQNPLLFYRTT